MNDAKIQLSGEELDLVQNAGVLLTKNKIIEKVYALFGEMAHNIRDVIAGGSIALPAEVLAPSPKISRGEKYEGLPYVMLDYPRLFGKTDIFAIRTLFWWGHFFSITLHLKGQYREQYREVLLDNLSLLADNDFHICIADSEWQHSFREDNYVPLKQLQVEAVEKILSGNDFCKLSARILLKQWNEADTLLYDLYRAIFKATGLVH